jgi:aminoglycoside phosphotransferase (APT) family kinase protein
VPVPRARTDEEAVAGLTRWVSDHFRGASEIAIRLLPGPRASGFSCETVLFDAEWSANGESHRAALAARVHPSGYSLYRQHDLDRQWRIMDAVRRQGTVPVPRVVGDSTGSTDYLGQPFFVMERVEGQTCPDSPPYSIRGWLKEASDVRQRQVVERCVDLLAALHGTDIDRLPAHVIGRDVPVGIEAQVLDYKSFLDWVTAGRDVPELERAYYWLCRQLPSHDDRVLCWGDSRLGNILFADDRPVAVLDWEMAGLGPPEADLGWWLVFDRIHTDGLHVSRLSGFPTEDQIVTRYEQSTGRSVRRLRYYMVWAALRAAVLLFRFHDMLITTGMAPPNVENAPYQPALRVLDGLLGSAPA